jgi:hypothetical protein
MRTQTEKPKDKKPKMTLEEKEAKRVAKEAKRANELLQQARTAAYNEQQRALSAIHKGNCGRNLFLAVLEQTISDFDAWTLSIDPDDKEELRKLMEDILTPHFEELCVLSGMNHASFVKHVQHRIPAPPLTEEELKENRKAAHAKWRKNNRERINNAKLGIKTYTSGRATL